MGLADGLELKTPDTAEEKMAFVRQMRARAEKAGDMVLAREFRNAEIRLQRQMAESPEVLPPERATPLADTFESMARESARADAEVFRRVGLDIDRTQRGLDDLAEILSKPDGTPLPPTKAKKALETWVAQLENEIETVKRQAAEEGC
jgi:hypothetical protein